LLNKGSIAKVWVRSINRDPFGTRTRE